MAKERHKTRRTKKMLILAAALLIIGFLIFQIAYIKYSAPPVARPEIPRGEQVIGNGPDLRYAVLGDSTAISQGGDYQKGYAVASAQHLAKGHTVFWKNVAVSGSRATDITTKQVPQITAFKPDFVLIVVGANDVTHLTSTSTVRSSLNQAVAALRTANPSVRIIVTGSPDMGSVPRFAQPVRWIAGKQTEHLNKVVMELARQQHLVFAPIAEQTGPTFRKHPELFAEDKFHPTTDGYQLWTPVIQHAIDQAFTQ